MRIKDYPQTDTLEPSDVFVIDGNKGTGCITSADMGIVTTDDPTVSHRNVFRGKYLGDVFTEAQKKAIKDGTFDDLYVGDYWEINGVKWRIADINYWWHIYTSNPDDPTYIPNHDDNHLVIVPDDSLYMARINADATDSSTGYLNSELKKTGLNQALTMAENAFGASHIFEHLMYSTTGATSRAAVKTKIDLMTQAMVYGSDLLNREGADAWYINTIGSNYENTQLALFRLNRSMIHVSSRVDYWLREILTFSQSGKSVYGIRVSVLLLCGQTLTSNPQGIRPSFAITG